MSAAVEIELTNGSSCADTIDGQSIVPIEEDNQVNTEYEKNDEYKLNKCIHSWYTLGIVRTFKKRRKVPSWMKVFLITLFVVLYFIYFTAVLLIKSKIEEENYWCDSDGFLIVVTAIVCIGVFHFQVSKKYILNRLIKSSPFQTLKKWSQLKITQIIVYMALGIGFATFIILDVKTDPGRLTSAFGIFAILGLACLLSAAPSQIQFRQVVWGIGMQFTFGLLILRTSVGQGTFNCLGKKFTTFMGFTTAGATFAFGDLATKPSAYVFSILTVILFFGMVVSILYYYGILQWVIIKLGSILENTMGTTPCESMATAANVFLGTSEAPLVILPYIPRLTNSELHAVMTGGYATVAGGVLSAYVAFGIKASHLMSASIMSAPAALAISKMIYPETDKSKTDTEHFVAWKCEEKNLLHAIVNGLSTAVVLIGNITASIVAFIAFIAFINAFMDWFCQLLDYEQGTCEFQGLLGIILAPVAWLLGVPIEDCRTVGYLLGTRIMLTEFYSYRELGKLYTGGQISERAVIISTYAFCGFANIANMGSTLASLGSMAPTRRGDIAKLLVSALTAGNMACFLTAAVAGTILEESHIEAIHFNSTTFNQL